MMHPAEYQIALFAGGDLGRWERWRISRHLARCPQCHNEVQSLRDASNQLRELAAEMPALPAALNFDRLAAEMTANIRLGLAAGEAIAIFDKPLRSKSRFGWPAFNTALVAVGALAIFGVAFWTSLPPQQADHLLSSLARIRTERIGTLLRSAPAAGNPASAGPNREDVVIEASSAGIQLRENGRAMSLLPHSDGATVSVNMHGSAGVRFVDTDTGQVTTNKVYYAEQ
jgi:hypothetical protein